MTPQIIDVPTTAQFPLSGRVATSGLSEQEAIAWATGIHHGQAPEKLWRFTGQYPIGGKSWVIWWVEWVG